MILKAVLPFHHPILEALGRVRSHEPRGQAGFLGPQIRATTLGLRSSGLAV
jgi:hypothetical protein